MQDTGKILDIRRGDISSPSPAYSLLVITLELLVYISFLMASWLL